MKRVLAAMSVAAVSVALAAPCRAGEAKEGAAMPAVWECAAKDTLTAVEMNRGDTLRFTLRNGQVRTLVLEDTSAKILESGEGLGGIVYSFSGRVRVDGQPLTLRRYVCTQESFYEPYVINGMRLWFDTVLDVFRLIPMRYPRTGNLRWRPRKHARFAVQDATLPPCPQEMKHWYPNEKNSIDIGDCYGGDDCWMGPYEGVACHGGLDINHRKGEPLWAPIYIDDQWLFNSVAAGDNNNRWRGVRRWPNGDVWALQTHHLVKLLVPEHTPLRAGVQYATAAGVHVGRHQHTHFEFKVAQRAGDEAIDFDRGRKLETRIYRERADGGRVQPAVIHLDPWILFWQIFETSKRRSGAVRAAMEPVSPARTGRPVRFSARASRAGPGGRKLRYYWAFGDGGWSDERAPAHVFARPGVYPVTLVVDDGVDRASCTQHLTVNGSPVRSPVLALAAPDEPAFRARPPDAMDVYGRPVRLIPHTLSFVARPGRPAPSPRTVELRNIGGGTLPGSVSIRTRYERGSRWSAVKAKGSGNRRVLEVSVNAAGLKPGRYAAHVYVACTLPMNRGALDSPQGFRVALTVPDGPPAARVTIDDRDDGFYCTPYFWVGHRLRRCTKKGFRGFYLTNGGRAQGGEFARFTPHLEAGTYRVSFARETPFRPRTRFSVRVRHAGGVSVLTAEEGASRLIGTFEFLEGTDGFVELLAEGSTGLVIADAVVFQRATGAGQLE